MFLEVRIFRIKIDKLSLAFFYKLSLAFCKSKDTVFWPYH